MLYRVGLFPAPDDKQEEKEGREGDRFTDSVSSTQRETARREQIENQPPVEEGDTREVEIQDLGEQGDGIARIGPGYVVFVSGTDIGERVRIRISDARDDFAFAEVIERL